MKPLKPQYIYTHNRTSGTTGFFSCEPSPEPQGEEALALLLARPQDNFLRQYLLRQALQLDESRWHSLAEECLSRKFADQDAHISSLASFLLEWRALASIKAEEKTIRQLESMAPPFSSPLSILRHQNSPQSCGMESWIELFRANIQEHRAIAPEDMQNLPPIYPQDAIDAEAKKLLSRHGLLARERNRPEYGELSGEKLPDPKITLARARDALTRANLLAGPEMRHEASLSPIALLREWRIDIDVDQGACSHGLRGRATAYGRGLSLAGARAACLMEIVERASAHAGIFSDESGSLVSQRASKLALWPDTYANLEQNGIKAIDPYLLCGETCSREARLHWLEGRDARGAITLVPAQAVFLFSNLDEPDFFEAIGSTGLAAGNTLAQAKLSALTEIMERQAHANTPFSIGQCFQLTARDARIRSLLDDYGARGIRVQFQDISPENGFPVYRCFVTGRDGQVAQASGAGLDGRRAILSALTETPWPYVWAKPAPWGTPSGIGLKNLPTRHLEDLPDFSLQCAEANLALLENMLLNQGQNPIYADISRADLGFPVVRAILPGISLDADFSLSSPPSLELLARWRLNCGSENLEY